MTIDIAELKAKNPISAVVGHYTRLTRAGSTYRGKCPVHGGDGDNLVVYPESDRWHCFSCNCHDGHADQIGFLELMLGTDFKGVAEYLGAAHEWKPELVKPARPPQPERVTSKPPPDAGVPKMAIKGLGEPVATWEYKDFDGGTLGYVARYETEQGKEIRQFSWGARGTDKPAWCCSHFSKPRPIYGLDRLADRPDAPVLVVEGEKAADAAQALLPGYVAVTFCGGAQAWKHADFSPLSGKTVLLWPDNDQIGVDCMSKLAQVLADPAGLACRVRIIDPSGQEPGADAADWTGTTAELVAWAKPRASDVIQTAPPKDDIPVAFLSQGDGTVTRIPAPELADSSAAQEPQPLNAGDLSLSAPLAPPLEPSEQSTGDLQPEPPLEPGTTATRPPRPARKPRKPYIAASGGNVLPEPELDDAILPLELSEVGVAARFCDLYHEDFRVVHEWGGKHGVTWLAWDGTRWKKEPTRKTAYQKMSILCCGLKYHDAARGMTEFAKAKFERAQFISSCLNQAQFDARIIAPPDVWDANPLMLGTPAGVVDLAVGKIIEADRDQFITRQTAVAPEPGPHPLFDSVIARASGGDETLRQYIWRALGYAITGDQREEAFWFLYGKAQSGKTTFIEAVAAILGRANEGGYATTCDMDLFVENKHDRGNDRLAELSGARFVYASETEEGRNWKAALLKLAVGGDTLRGRMLYENSFSFRPTHHLWIFGNSRPHLKSKDDGIARRLHLLEYPGVISNEERDNTLKLRMAEEYPAILHSMILACLDWQSEGLGKPESVAYAVDKYLQSEDMLAQWIDECCEQDELARVQASVAYRSFSRWAENSGEYRLSQKRFSAVLEDRGWQRKHTRAGNMLIGWKLKQTDDERSPPPSYDHE